MPRRPCRLDPLALERRHDGPVVPWAPGPVDPPGTPGRDRLFQRLADEQRRRIARRRAALVLSAAAQADSRLADWAATLRLYRDQGAGWAARRGQAGARIAWSLSTASDSTG